MPPSILWDLTLPHSFSELSPMANPHCPYSQDPLVGARIRPSSRCLDLRTLCECGTRYDRTDGFAGIRRVLPLPQRGRYSVTLDKETDLRFVHRKKKTTHRQGKLRIR